MGFATEELALRVGETIGGLLNATLVSSNQQSGIDNFIEVWNRETRR